MFPPTVVAPIGSTVGTTNLDPIGNAATTVLTGAGLTARRRLVVGSTVFLGAWPGPHIGRGGGRDNSRIYGLGSRDLFFVSWDSLIVDFDPARDITEGSPTG
jgi:hypothetical protein